MLIYHYSKITGEYLRSAECRLDPRENKPLVPASATLDPPPVAETNQRPVYKDGWTLAPDYRSEVRYTSDGEEITFSLGEAPTPEMLTEIPFSVHQDRKKDSLRFECQNHIHAGFTSAALGTLHKYPCQDHDQRNLTGLVTKSILESSDVTWSALFWCEDEFGVWDRRDHTRTQIQDVALIGANHVIDAQNKLKTLITAVENASLIEELDQIIW